MKPKIFVTITIALAFAGLFLYMSFIVITPSTVAQSRVTSKHIFSELEEKLIEWDDNVYITNCESKEAFKDNKFTNIACTAYSLSRNQTRLIIWKEGKITLSEPITMNPSYRNQIDDNSDLDSLSEINYLPEDFIKEYLASTPELNASIINVSIDTSGSTRFNDKYIFNIQFYDVAEKDEDGVIKLLKEIYFDAMNGVQRF